jgi:hypothetical protein
VRQIVVGTVLIVSTMYASDDEGATIHTNDELMSALARYIPYDGLSTLTSSAYIARAYHFRRRAEAIFQAECRRQQSLPSTTAEHDHLIEIVRQKGVVFRKIGVRVRGMYKWTCRPGTRLPDVQTGHIILSTNLIDRGCPVPELLLLLRHELSHAVTPGHGHDTMWRDYCLAIGGNGARYDTSHVTRGLLGHRVEIYCPVGGYETKGKTGHYFQTAQIKPTPRKLQKCCRKCYRDTGQDRTHSWRRVSVLDTSSAFDGRHPTSAAAVHPTVQLLDAHTERNFLSTFVDTDYVPDTKSVRQGDENYHCDLCGWRQPNPFEVCQECRMVV